MRGAIIALLILLMLITPAMAVSPGLPPAIVYDPTAYSFDNSGGGSWSKWAGFRFSAPLTEYAQYKIVIDGRTWSLYNASGGLKASITVSEINDLWSNVDSTGKDIRVFDQNGNQLFFYIERWDYQNQYAVIWVNVTAGCSALRIAYGNPSATISGYHNGSRTFIFFDDFETLDTINKWQILGGDWVVSNGELVWNGNPNADPDGLIVTRQTFTSNVIVEVRGIRVSPGGTTGTTELNQIVMSCSDIGNFTLLRARPDIGELEIFEKSAGTYTKYATATISTTYGVWRISKAYYNGSAYIYEYYDDNYNLINRVAWSTLWIRDGYIGIREWGSSEAGDVKYDWIRVYKLADPADVSSFEASHSLDTSISINLRQTVIPCLDLSVNSATVEASFEISTWVTNVWVPVPVAAKLIDADFVYNLDGSILVVDDNRYANANSVTVSIPISINTATESELPNELYLDSDSKTFEFKKSIRIYNPSDISIMATLSVNPSTIGVAQAYLDGSPMSLFNGSLVSSIILGPGESKVMELTATLPISKQELEFRATLDDFFEINSFDQAVKMAQSATEGKIETVTKVIAIDSADFKSFGNRTVIIPLDIDVDDVIEAKALTGSKELLEVREGKDGKAEIVVPATVFEGTPLGTQHAEIKVIYNKKPAWWESLPFLKSLGGFFEFLAKIFGFGR